MENKMEKHLMVDIETFSTQHDAAIASIGAVYFDPMTSEIQYKFDQMIDVRTYKNPVLGIDTVYWWLNQSKEAKNSICPASAKAYRVEYNVGRVLNEFYNFAIEADHIWSHATFDFVIINNNLKNIINRQLPYKKSRDIRTLQHMAGDIDVDDVGTAHIAIDDAIYQARCVSKMLQKLEK